VRQLAIAGLVHAVCASEPIILSVRREGDSSCIDKRFYVVLYVGPVGIKQSIKDRHTKQQFRKFVAVLNQAQSEYKHSLTLRVRRYVVIATKPVHRLQISQIVHN